MDDANSCHKIEILHEVERQGVACLIIKHETLWYKWYCVYYGVLPSHPLYGEHWRLWSRVLDKRHLTYDSGGCLTGSKRLDVLAKFPGRWWVGWDTLRQEGKNDDLSTDKYVDLAEYDMGILADVDKGQHIPLEE